MLAIVHLAEPLAKSGEAVKAGPVGLGVILLLIIACYFLFKSMSKHMRKVRENFPAEGFPQPAPRTPGRTSAARPAQAPAQAPVQQPVQEPPTSD